MKRTFGAAPAGSVAGAARLGIVVASLVLGLPLHQTFAAGAIKAEVTTTVANGFARLVFKLAQETESEVKISNGIVIISFHDAVDVTVDKISAGAEGYVTAARLDPDGKGVRLALARKVTVNSMAAGEKLFVDLLPETWTGMPPGLPKDVIDELSRRAREAEKKMRQQRALAQLNVVAPVRVRVTRQPTFTRFVFELPELTAITSDRTPDKLTLSFDALLKFDLADAKAALPKGVSAMDSDVDKETSLVRFTFADKVDVRTFREDNNYVIDFTTNDSKEVGRDSKVTTDALVALAIDATEKKKAPLPMGAPDTVPVRADSNSESQVKRETALPAKESAPVALPVPQPAAAAPAAPVAERAAPKIPKSPPTSNPEVAAPPAAGVPPLTQAVSKIEPAVASGPAASNKAGVVSVTSDGETLKLMFPFGQPVPSAVFLRADTLWLVFDSNIALDVTALNSDKTHTIRSATFARIADADVVLVKLAIPRVASVLMDDNAWVVTVGAEANEPTKPLSIRRNIGVATHASITIPFEGPRGLYRIADPDLGDTLLVVTALGPARGFVKSQDFVELRALASSHGVVFQPLADDIDVELAPDKIVLGRPAGLTLSPPLLGRKRADATEAPPVVDSQIWGYDREANFSDRKAKLIAAAADASDAKRLGARLDLARFYLARDMNAEAKGVLDVALAENAPAVELTSATVLRSIANIRLGRADEALKELANPQIGNLSDAPLWKALALARLGRWSEARDGFRSAGVAIGSLPLELQRVILVAMVRSAIEVGDFVGAAGAMTEFETVGVPHELEPTMSILSGRLAEGLGHVADALNSYRAAADSWDRPVAAQGQLREILLRRSLGQLPGAEAVADLETLTTAWRGDETEVEALALLSHLYLEDGRYRDSFQIMRTAVAAHQNSDIARRIQEEAAAAFDSLFLQGKGDAMPAIDTLSLFYDFRELTPIGRRGDEMIRRLADRLVSVDLLDQAAELLQHQVDNRLQGTARAQIAARLAVIYLMNRKPERALAALRSTRMADLPTDLRNQRLMIEARVLSDTGRPNLALEVVGGLDGPEVIRLRSDIYWAAKMWREAAEQIEQLYGDRWRQFEPLNETERNDILRAAIGYTLGDDAIGLGRFRERYAAKFGDGPDARAFAVVTTPFSAGAPEFGQITRSVMSVDTLSAFLQDLRTRFPNSGAVPGAIALSKGAVDTAPVKANPFESKADSVPTGGIPRVAPGRAGAS